MARDCETQTHISLPRQDASGLRSCAHHEAASVSFARPSSVLAELLSRLPEHDREVLVLRNIQGHTFEQIAAQLSRSPSATRLLWLGAIDRLRAIQRKEEQDGS
ncbi:RNA polymerase sigma factor [Anatilimnocola sp. NA78]|uniref:RNA polymerase sigma factor n=1 Tax=Anatilimnocola sp. NA78 TaxID=3415683 RepID=UPI003CE47A66